MDRFIFIARRNHIVIRPAWLAHDAHLTRFRDKGYSVLTYDYHLPPPLRLQAVALLLAVALKDWPGKRFGYRFAPPGAHRGDRAAARGDRREFRGAQRMAVEILIQPHERQSMIRELAQEERSLAEVCEAHGLPREMVELALGIAPLVRDSAEADRQMWKKHVEGW